VAECPRTVIARDLESCKTVESKLGVVMMRRKGEERKGCLTELERRF
jgi:hypothetical protein